MKKTTLFFDAAGTLIQVREPVGSCYARLAADFGFEFTAESAAKAFKAALGKRPPITYPPELDQEAREARDCNWWKSLVHEVFEEAGSPVEDAEQFAKCFEALFTHYGKSDSWKLFDPLPRLLEDLSDFDLFVLSNFDRRLHSVLEGLGVVHFFQAVFTSSEIGFSKPSPEIFSAACRLSGAAPSEIVHIGDDPIADWEGAAKAGLEVFKIRDPALDLPRLAKNLRYDEK